MRDRRIGRTWDDATRCGQKTRAKVRKRNIYQRHGTRGS